MYLIHNVHPEDEPYILTCRARVSNMVYHLALAPSRANSSAWEEEDLSWTHRDVHVVGSWLRSRFWAVILWQAEIVEVGCAQWPGVGAGY